MHPYHMVYGMRDGPTFLHASPTCIHACRAQLPEVLRTAAKEYDYVAVTSPEAATVFLEAWEAAGKPQVHLICLCTVTCNMNSRALLAHLQVLVH